MRSLSRRVALASVLALLSTLLAAPLAQAADTTYEIQEGQPFPIGAHCDPQTFAHCTLAESMRFFPRTLNVHKGDVLHFTSESFHTATVLPKNINADEWIDANASNPTQPFSLAVADPDEGTTPTQLLFNTAVVFPSSFTCGGPNQSPCDYDGSAPLNSGAPIGQGQSLDFSVTVNANPGDFFYVICLIHHHMRMKVNVVANGSAASTQSDIDAAKSATIANDFDDANALHNKLSAKQTSHSIGGGHEVWDVFNGFDTDALSLYSQYPKKVVIHKGDKVRWHFGQLVSEVHSTVFPAAQADQWANTQIYCDPDRSFTGDGPQHATLAENQDPTQACSGGPAQIELPIPNGDTYGTGNGKVSNAH
ncbi:MAG: hypothetical protein M3290_10880, partial [Actinomycetota bacterium]|nr:hypothetical protein [Actinomycetota bacterium]